MTKQAATNFFCGQMILCRRDDLCVFFQARIIDIFETEFNAVHYKIHYINNTDRHDEVVSSKEALRRFVEWTKENLGRANALLLLRRTEQKFVLVSHDLRRQLLLARFAEMMDELAFPLK